MENHMDNEQTFTPVDLVNYASQKDAANLSTAFKDIVGQKVLDAIQNRKIEIASSMFNSAEEQQPETEASDEVDVSVQAGQEEQNQGTEESHEDTEVTS